MYHIPTKLKFIIEVIIIILFTILCTLIEIPWWQELSNQLNPILATMIVVGLAFFPGIMITSTICGIILDEPQWREIIPEDLPDVTILIAAYNEEKSIYDTLKSISIQEYPKNLFVKVIDNNSKDNTKKEICRGIKDFHNISIEYLFEKTQGKFAALNHGLSKTKTKYVITIDADTYLYTNAIATLVTSMIEENKKQPTGAIAGALFVKNSRTNFLAKMQEWEYFLSIAGIKRAQGLYESTLVAQGAFSIYQTQLLKEIGGWKDSIGEDIVLTWEILSKDYITRYEDCAVAFTNAPTELKVFVRQRARWARGMIEGFRHFSFSECKSIYPRFFIFCDYFLFMIDLSITCFFIPGIIAAIFFHNFLIVGLMTIILFPITLILFAIMLIVEKSRVYDPLGLKIRHHYLGLFLYIITYSIILSPTCVYGYIQEFFGTKRKWK